MELLREVPPPWLRAGCPDLTEDNWRIGSDSVVGRGGGQPDAHMRHRCERPASAEGARPAQRRIRGPNRRTDIVAVPLRGLREQVAAGERELPPVEIDALMLRRFTSYVDIEAQWCASRYVDTAGILPMYAIENHRYRLILPNGAKLVSVRYLRKNVEHLPRAHRNPRTSGGVSATPRSRSNPIRRNGQAFDAFRPGAVRSACHLVRAPEVSVVAFRDLPEVVVLSDTVRRRALNPLRAECALSQQSSRSAGARAPRCICPEQDAAQPPIEVAPPIIATATPPASLGEVRIGGIRRKAAVLYASPGSATAGERTEEAALASLAAAAAQYRTDTNPRHPHRRAAAEALFPAAVGPRDAGGRPRPDPAAGAGDAGISVLPAICAGRR